RSAVKAGSSASKQVMERLGIEGARAMKKLSPAARDKLATMSGALAKSPHRTAWLDAIAKHGDSATNWLWKHKGGVAVGTVATAILVKPDKFLEMTGSVAESAVEATTKHVISPVVKPASVQLGASIVTAMAASVGVVALWASGGLTGLLALFGLSKWALNKAQSE
ncbi:MAG: hypothetical protein KDA51_19285, partial [Planctomycetales bacterium]|nr:hypothetical protein [Planctomycetales bacterium]